jgi:hypothetical protein
MSLQQLPLSKVKNQKVLHPAQTHLRYFCARLQNVQLPSKQSETSSARIPLTHKCHLSFIECFIFHILFQIIWH